MHRSFVHLELNVDDPDRAKAFYRELFGWDVVDVAMEGGAYTQITPPRGLAGGIQKKLNAKAPSAWVPYVAVKSVEASLGKARSAGGRVMVDRTVVPGHGALAIICDPAGAWLGLWEVAGGEKETADAQAEAEGEPAAPVREQASEKKAAEKPERKKATKKASKTKTAKKSAKKSAKANNKKADNEKTTTKRAGKKKATTKRSPSKGTTKRRR